MIACILLASGFGKRFGGNKLLAPAAGKPLFRHALDTLLTLQAAMPELEVIAVTQYPEIMEQAQRLNIRAVWNPEAAEGIAASIRLGVAAAPKADWYAFFVADQPALKAATIRNFLEEAVSSGKPLAAVCAENVPGNPTLFHCRWRQELLALRGDTGGRRILRKHPDEIYSFEVPQEELQDVDTLKELEQVESIVQRKPGLYEN